MEDEPGESHAAMPGTMEPSAAAIGGVVISGEHFSHENGQYGHEEKSHGPNIGRPRTQIDYGQQFLGFLIGCWHFRAYSP